MKYIWDRIGIATSSICLIHCLLVPLVLVIFPFIEAGHDQFHQYITLGVVIPAFLAFIPGYKKHQNQSILIIAIVGLALILGAAFTEDRLISHNIATVITITGSLLMILAHTRNIKHAHACRTCQH